MIAPPIILDISRLYSRRFHNIDTGIDRVERGYFNHYALDERNRFLIRSGSVYTILNAEKARIALADQSLGKVAAKVNLFRLAERSSLRNIELWQFGEYINVGHSGHARHFYHSLQAVDTKIKILIHDTIPLDYPQYCRTDTINAFQTKFNLWAKYADQIITPSHYTRDRVKAHAPNCANILPVPLAITESANCRNVKTENAFLILGTIEPRKNHMTIFKAWEMLSQELGDACPKLWIIGARGWNNDEVFEFLDHSPLIGKTVFELGAISDDEMKNYVCKAKALLFPSFVEGFGLPLYEAAIAKKAVIASKISAFEESFLNLKPFLLPPSDIISWKGAIKQAVKNDMHIPKFPSNSEAVVNWKQHIMMTL